MNINPKENGIIDNIIKGGAATSPFLLRDATQANRDAAAAATKAAATKAAAVLAARRSEQLADDRDSIITSKLFNLRPPGPAPNPVDDATAVAAAALRQKQTTGKDTGFLGKSLGKATRVAAGTGGIIAGVTTGLTTKPAFAVGKAIKSAYDQPSQIAALKESAQQKLDSALTYSLRSADTFQKSYSKAAKPGEQDFLGAYKVAQDFTSLDSKQIAKHIDKGYKMASSFYEPRTEYVPAKYNTFYKIILLVLFFVVFLKVIINIFRFFGIDIIDLYSYMGWFIFFMIILIFIPHDYTTLKLN